MSARDAFGPNLRRIRIQRGISLDTIARETKVPVELWDALEHNDFSRWPTGLFARSYIREYARISISIPKRRWTSSAAGSRTATGAR